MADRQKLIAVCLSQAHSFLNTGFLSELISAAEKDGYGVGIFSSSLDFLTYQKDSRAPRAGYLAIRYELFDALILIHHTFHDDNLTNEIISGARSHGVPVFCAGPEFPGCHTIVNSYEDSYKSLIRHVIRDHGARDTFFIAGMKNEENSEGRLRCYREVLKEEGLPFSENQVAYGNFWSKPATEITRRLIRSGKKLPDAIICANDSMAIAVMDELKRSGLRVPEDVIVTGYDGSPAAYMVRPHLTTCGDNPRELAVRIMDMLRRIKAGEHPPMTLYHPFVPVFSGSCGCAGGESDRYDPLTVFRRSMVLNNHENNLYHKVERMLTQKEPSAFLRELASSILPDSGIYLNKRFLNVYSGVDFTADSLEEDLLCIPYHDTSEEPEIRECRLSELRPPEGRETGGTIFHTICAGSVACGFYAAWIHDLEEDVQLIKRISDVLNMVFAIQLGNARQRMLITSLDNSLYLDPATGLSNLRGLTRWFGDYCTEKANHQRHLAVSVYSVYRYNYLYESYGMNETEEIVRLVANRLTSSNARALIIARTGADQFAVVHSGDRLEGLTRLVHRETNDFFRQLDAYNATSSRKYFVEVHSGTTTLEAGWEAATLENLIRLAVGEMYLDRMRNNGVRELAKPSAAAAELYSAFNLLMEKNLFKFYFQPIVEVRNAQIFAYEALMRTDYLLNLSPLEILATAREYNRLYDVERATFFGIMDRFVRDYSEFYGCKVFINTIPGYFLNEEDCEAVRTQYESYLDCFVYELTEQGAATAEELARIKSLCKAGGTVQVAIDDYGTGHSNIVSVLQYSPQIIKIDRALISGIQNDSNKQLFVRNTIDLAHQNGIRALAEGVETSEELRTVIDFGIDLVQGFYTGRPAEHPIASVNEAVRNEILAENLLLARFDRDARTYAAADGDTIDLLDLAMRQYSSVEIAGGRVTLVGREKQSVDLLIRFADDAEATVVLNNASLKGFREPVMQLGDRSRVTVVLEGNNVMYKDGIHVPPGAGLTLRGGGSLKILNNRNYSVGIGSSYNDPYGTIVVDLDGSLAIQSSGDRLVSLGGGRSGGGGILLKRGSVSVTANGISVLGIGSVAGDARIHVEGASVTAHIEANDAVGIGSLSGEAAIRSGGTLDVTVDSERSTGLGSMSGTGNVLLDGGSVRVTTRVCGAAVYIHGEGNRVAGLGSPDGACDTRIEGGEVDGVVWAGEPLPLGNEHSRAVVTGGNVLLSPSGANSPVSPAGDPLRYLSPEGSRFEQVFRDRRGTWTYVAERNAEGRLGVWVPAEK